MLSTNKNALVGLGYALQDILGVSTCVAGLPCTQTLVASLAVLVGAGRIYSLQNIDGTAYGTLAADTANQIIKQGIQQGSVTLATPAPVTAGQSINYLIEASYQDSDTTPVVLPFYNSANPPVPFSGPGNSGATSNTQRKGALVLQVKAGAAATTGTQTTPAADSGFVGLYVVTVANGQATVTAANIQQPATAPFIQATLGNSTVTSTANVGTGNDGPVVQNWVVADGPTNEKIWLWRASSVGGSSSLSLAAVPDTGIPTSATAFVVSRTGNAVLNLIFGNPVDNPAFNFSGTGLLTFANAVTTTTAPGAGGAGALPATPAGYWSVSLGGATKKIAFY